VLFRSELKSDIDALRKSLAARRSEIVALKRQLKALGAQIKQAVKATSGSRPKVAAPATPADARKVRFSAKRFAAQRAKLGITQLQMSKLLGVSALSVFKWETGKARPRMAQLLKIQEVRSLGKREAAARLGQ